MVDARGGAMRGCRHSGVRVIIPPRKASMPMRITCRYLRKEKLIHPPPLMEGEACASRILEMGPVAARFLGPVIIEIPHFASARGKEREITILRSDSGETWKEHTLEASEEAVQEVLNESFEGEELSALEDLNTNRITRILTTDFPHYFAIITRVRQEVHGVGPEGGMVSSTVVPQVQAIFPEGALTKKIRVGLQAQPIAPELVAKLLGNRVAVSPIVTVEPRRRKFHKPITLTIPVPQAATKGMINQYSGDAPTLRLLCSITGSTKSGGSTKAQWEDVTGSTPLTFVNDCVSFTTTVSARFWLMDCRQVSEVTRFATELYQEAVYVPFMSKFVIFAKRHDPYEAQLRVFCMTDDKEDKTLESQEHFVEVAKSRDVEVLEGKMQYLEFAGNLIPVTKSGEQLKLAFEAFHENRLPFTIRVKDPHVEPMGRIAFMKEPKVGRGEPPQTPICNLNVALPDVALSEPSIDVLELVTLEKKYDFMQEAGLSKPELIHRADLRLSDIARELDKDWVNLAQQLEVSDTDIDHIKSETSKEHSEHALAMLRLWLKKSGTKATGNELEKGLRKICREDIIKKCMFNIELVTDDVEKAVAKVHLDQSGFDVFKEELGSSREASMRRGASLDISYDEQDIMKEAESAAETSSETGSLFERDQISQAFPDDKDIRIRRASKTPPPSPVELSEKGDDNEEKFKEVTFAKLLPEIKEVVVKKTHGMEIKSLEITTGIVSVPSDGQEQPARLTESETWPSGEMDTSQVSVSSLPDDEKSEPTTATISSVTAAEADGDHKQQENIEKTEIDGYGSTMHFIQKTTHMTLSMHEKTADDEGAHDAVAAYKIQSTADKNRDRVTASPESPELSFAEKRDFFQRLSLSSSSPSATPSPTLKTAAGTEPQAEIIISNESVVEESLSPEEQLSFAARLKFFEKPSETQDVKTEIKDITKEIWTIADVNEENSASNRVCKTFDNVSTVVLSNVVMSEEREPNEKSSSEKLVKVSETEGKDKVSLPLYEGKEVLETIHDANKKTKVEVLVKKLKPGTELIEICSVEKYEFLQTDTDSVDDLKQRFMPSGSDTEVKDREVIPSPKGETVISSLIEDVFSTEEKPLVKTDVPISESVSEPSKATTDAFKKDIPDKMEVKWQRQSPDNISLVKETLEPSLGKSEIFICTEETLDNVKKILSVADAESNVVMPESEVSAPDNIQVEADVDEESHIISKKESKTPEETENDISRSFGSNDGKSESCFSSLKDRSIEIEFLPVLEVSDDISKVSVDMTGHEHLGTPCSFSIEKQDELQQTFATSTEHHLDQTEEQRSVHSEEIPVLAAVEKAEYEDVEKNKALESEDLEKSKALEAEDIEKNKEAVSKYVEKELEYDVEKNKETKSEHIEKNKEPELEELMHKDKYAATEGRETLESVKITQFKEFSTGVYNVPSEKLKEKFSSTKIHIETTGDGKELKVTHKLDQFLDSVTQQSHDENSIFSLPSDLVTVDKRTEEWIDQSGEILLKEGGIKDYVMDSADNGLMYEDRPPTLEDEQHKRSSPTAESFDDKARVEQCDTDVMMQLLDFVSRNDIELSEVRTEDEAPDIEEDVSPSAEEEVRIMHDEFLTEEKKIVKDTPPVTQKSSEDCLKIETEAEHLLPSPLRSSFDSVTSPSRKDAPSDNIETIVEMRQLVQKSALSREIHPQSSLEVEVGSHDSDDVGSRDLEREIVPLAFVEEEDQLKQEHTSSISVEKYNKRTQKTAATIEPHADVVSERLGQDEIAHSVIQEHGIEIIELCDENDRQSPTGVTSATAQDAPLDDADKDTKSLTDSIIDAKGNAIESSPQLTSDEVIHMGSETTTVTRIVSSSMKDVSPEKTMMFSTTSVSGPSIHQTIEREESCHDKAKE